MNSEGIFRGNTPGSYINIRPAGKVTLANQGTKDNNTGRFELRFEQLSGQTRGRTFARPLSRSAQCTTVPHCRRPFR